MNLTTKFGIGDTVKYIYNTTDPLWVIFEIRITIKNDIQHITYLVRNKKRTSSTGIEESALELVEKAIPCPTCGHIKEEN